MDIESRKDIEQLVNTFYDKVKKDDTIGFFFNDIAKVNWEHHLPILYNFWETILLGATSYSKNAMAAHYTLNRKVPMEEKHFQRWLQLFFETVDEFFAGGVATMAKKRAKSIASLIQFKMKQESNGLNTPGKA